MVTFEFLLVFSTLTFEIGNNNSAEWSKFAFNTIFILYLLELILVVLIEDMKS